MKTSWKSFITKRLLYVDSAYLIALNIQLGACGAWSKSCYVGSLNFYEKAPGRSPQGKIEKKIEKKKTKNNRGNGKRTNKGYPDQHCWVKPLAAFGISCTLLEI